LTEAVFFREVPGWLTRIVVRWLLCDRCHSEYMRTLEEFGIGLYRLFHEAGR
jgi:hypothetical protein